MEVLVVSLTGPFSIFGRKPKATAKPGRASAPVALPLSLSATDPKEASKAALPKFKASATDQVDRRRADRSSALRMKLRAAFTPSQPVADRRMFAGRIDVLSNMISAIEDQKLHLVLYGPRGIGKTSLMQMLSRAAEDARYLVHRSSCGAASNFQETFRAAAQDIPLLFHSGFGPTTEEAESGASLADLLPPGEFSPRQFGELCARLTGTRVLIVLDEFDRAESPEFRRELAELLKILSDRSVRVQLVIAGVAADLADLVEHIPSIRRNIIAMRIPQLTEAEVRELITAGEQMTGLVFEEDARSAIVRVARGWPYISSLICHHAALATIDAGRTTVNAEDVTHAIQYTVDEFGGRIAKPLQTQADRLIGHFGGRLGVAAEASMTAGGAFDSADIRAIAKSDAETLAVRRMIERLASEKVAFEVTEDADGQQYAFVDDGVPAYIWFRTMQNELEPKQAAPVIKPAAGERFAPSS